VRGFSSLGRKRKEVVKKTVTISVDPEIWDKLKATGVNRSRLFDIASRKYLKKKSRK